MIFFLFIFGLAVGSFVNVVVYRLNNPLPKRIKNKLGGRSFCPQCKKQIVWYDNLPLLSFILLRGKCRQCRSSISWQYPLVEMSMGLLFAGVGLSIGRVGGIREAVEAGYLLFLTAALLAIFVSDLKYMTIPDEVVAAATMVAVVWRIFSGFEFSFFLAGLGAAGFFLVLVLVTRQKGMGWGDVKFAWLMGLVLGWPKVAVGLYLAFLTGGLAGAIMILTKKRRFGEQIPFGPFLVAGTYACLFGGDLILELAKSILSMT